MEEGDVLGISELDCAITADHVPLSLLVMIEVSLRVGIGNAANFHLERKPQAAKALSGAQNKVFALWKKQISPSSRLPCETQKPGETKRRLS